MLKNTSGVVASLPQTSCAPIGIVADVWHQLPLLVEQPLPVLRQSKLHGFSLILAVLQQVSPLSPSISAELADQISQTPSNCGTAPVRVLPLAPDRTLEYNPVGSPPTEVPCRPGTVILSSKAYGRYEVYIGRRDSRC